MKIQLFDAELDLRKMAYFYSKKCYSKQEFVELIKKVYDIDILEEINKDEYKFIFRKNEENYIKNYYIRKTLDVFTDVEKHRHKFTDEYRLFYIKYIEGDGLYDELDNLTKSDHIHHIFPIVAGGSNDFHNLIAVCIGYHQLLHKNPCQHIEKYCFQALDYLNWVINNNNKILYILEENVGINLNDCKNKSYESLQQLLKGKGEQFLKGMEKCMHDFYVHIYEKSKY